MEVHQHVLRALLDFTLQLVQALVLGVLQDHTRRLDSSIVLPVMLGHPTLIKVARRHRHVFRVLPVRILVLAKHYVAPVALVPTTLIKVVRHHWHAVLA